MQIDTAAAIDLSKEKKQNESSFSDQMKAYIKHPGSGVLALLTLLGAVLTFALLFFLIGYILVKGVPYLSTDLFSLTYNSENLSLLPSLINTFILTVVSLVIAAPLGIFAAIYLVEYAKKGSKLVNVIRITAETLSGIPSIVYGLFGMLFFVTALHWGLSLLSGAFTLVIMILPLIMRTAEEALKSVPDSYREASFGLGAGKLRTIFTIVLPSAVPGILAGVILATGSKRASAKIPGVKEFEGKGVSYCAVCDAFFYRGKDVAVLGNSDFALHEAEELSHTASHVTIFTDGKKPEFSKENAIDVNTMKIQAIEGDERVQGLRLKGDVSLQEAGEPQTSFAPAEGVFVALGTAGSSEMARQIGAELNEKGNIRVNEEMETTVPGLYAAGDCTGGLLQVAKAVHDGAQAGLSACQYVRKLLKEQA